MTTYLTSREMIEQKLDYVHNNPAQGSWVLANDPLDYKYSSARFYEGDESEFDFLTRYMEYFCKLLMKNCTTANKSLVI